ncbi:unnamed protein product [Brassicogethes aeneus]|uniref:Uncharacterized protein n=1 Tax=Brassicogethes aeneus TaxID=1431903 RepID=A0A9P0AW47_BRAAE|nr:unnamed protein product [Brassicogethes aeneus]
MTIAVFAHKTIKMLRARRTMQKSGKEARKLGNNAPPKRRKLEGNSKRLVAATGFFTGGIKSKVAKKAKNSRQFQQKILEEDLHGLLFEQKGDSEDEFPHLRRSVRLQSRKRSFRHKSRDFSPVDTDVGFEKPATSRNTSKSIFREINKRCGESNTASTPLFDSRKVQTQQRDINLVNNGDLLENLTVKVDIDNKPQIGANILQEIHRVDRILSGQDSDSDLSPYLVRQSNNPDNNMEFKLYKPEEWVYSTPPRQRIVLPQPEESAIQPAILCSTRKQHNIFELRESSNIRMDFEKFHNHQPISLDQRFLKHITTIDVESQRSGDPIWGGMDFANHYIDVPNKPVRVTEATNYMEQPSYSTNDHFLTLTSRPSKTVAKMSRNSGKLRKVNIFGEYEESPQPSCSSTVTSQAQIDAQAYQRHLVDVDMDRSFAPLESSDDEGEGKKKFAFNPQMPSFMRLGEPDQSPLMFDFSKKHQ